MAHVLFPYLALLVTLHFQNTSSGTSLFLSVAITLCALSVLSCFVPNSSTLPSLCLTALGFVPWLCVGWHLYLELVPCHGEGEWKNQCWRKREKRKWGVAMQWMKLRVKERTQASGAKIQVSIYTKLSISRHPRFGEVCGYQLVSWQFCLAAAPQSQMKGRSFLILTAPEYCEGV